MRKYICTICGFIYDEAQGIPESGIAPGTKWEDLADDWTCPLCNALKENFEEQVEESKTEEIAIDENNDELGEMLNGELSALCSNLAKGAKKQYLEEESELFAKLSDYYARNTSTVSESCINHILLNIERDLNHTYPNANAIATTKEDRGAKRALLWTEKVTKILNSILSSYEKQGDTMLEGTKVHVCDICGFVYIGNEPPEICPICKVPKFKIIEIGR
ncbi:MAG TPA: rubredoxin [Epulopiscium sp.]|nr:rubredoxin [Candidatus Epulonipiscium sp.]